MTEDRYYNILYILLNRFPYSIVWTALPIFTWLIPFIGHTGIC